MKQSPYNYKVYFHHIHFHVSYHQPIHAYIPIYNSTFPFVFLYSKYTIVVYESSISKFPSVLKIKKKNKEKQSFCSYLQYQNKNGKGKRND